MGLMNKFREAREKREEVAYRRNKARLKQLTKERKKISRYATVERKLGSERQQIRELKRERMQRKLAPVTSALASIKERQTKIRARKTKSKPKGMAVSGISFVDRPIGEKDRKGGVFGNNPFR